MKSFLFSFSIGMLLFGLFAVYEKKTEKALIEIAIASFGLLISIFIP